MIDMQTQLPSTLDELHHWGVKGMRWGVRKQRMSERVQRFRSKMPTYKNRAKTAGKAALVIGGVAAAGVLGYAGNAKVKDVQNKRVAKAVKNNLNDYMDVIGGIRTVNIFKMSTSTPDIIKNYRR